jgi:hypothetical protein
VGAESASRMNLVSNFGYKNLSLCKVYLFPRNTVVRMESARSNTILSTNIWPSLSSASSQTAIVLIDILRRDDRDTNTVGKGRRVQLTRSQEERAPSLIHRMSKATHRRVNRKWR